MTLIFARTAGGIASSDVAAAVRSSCRSLTSSGTGAAGATCRSETAPAQSAHSFGGSAAASGRTKTCRARRKAIRFIDVLQTPLPEPKLPERKTKGVMFFNPSSGVKIVPSELSALDQPANESGLEVLYATHGLDCAALLRARL